MLFVEYSSDLEVDLTFQNFERELANLPGDYSPPTGCLLLAMVEKNAAGCVALRRLQNDVCEMKRLYVKPEFRNMKIGKALTKAAIGEAKRLAYKRMRLDSLPSMKEAQSLYKSLGFERITPYRFNPAEGTVFMELSLDVATKRQRRIRH